MDLPRPRDDNTAHLVDNVRVTRRLTRKERETNKYLLHEPTFELNFQDAETRDLIHREFNREESKKEIKVICLNVRGWCADGRKRGITDLLIGIKPDVAIFTETHLQRHRLLELDDSERKLRWDATAKGDKARIKELNIQGARATVVQQKFTLFSTSDSTKGGVTIAISKKYREVGVVEAIGDNFIEVKFQWRN